MRLAKPFKGKSTFRTAAGSVSGSVVGSMIVVEADGKIAKHLVRTHGFKASSIKMDNKSKKAAPKKKSTAKKAGSKKST